MKKPLTNYGHSVRVRLLAIANERGVQLEYVLLRYAFERFLFFSENSMKQSQWCAFLRKTNIEFVGLPKVVDRLIEFLMPILNEDEAEIVWHSSQKTWVRK